jgi:hypothetical protein
MTDQLETDLAKRALDDLFRNWLERCQEEVRAHLAEGGSDDPATVAQACPSLAGRPEVAEWMQRGKRT